MKGTTSTLGRVYSFECQEKKDNIVTQYTIQTTIGSCCTSSPDRNFCLRVTPKPYQWHAYNEFIQKMSQRDPLKKIILSFFFCNSLVSRRYPWSVPFPFFGSLSTLRKIHEYPVIFLTRRNFPLPFKAGFTLRSLNG